MLRLISASDDAKQAKVRHIVFVGHLGDSSGVSCSLLAGGLIISQSSRVDIGGWLNVVKDQISRVTLVHSGGDDAWPLARADSNRTICLRGHSERRVRLIRPYPLIVGSAAERGDSLD